MNPLELRKAARNGQLPMSFHTAYKYHSQKKYPNLIFKVAGKLYFDRDEWELMAERAKEKQAREAQQLRASRQGSNVGVGKDKIRSASPGFIKAEDA